MAENKNTKVGLDIGTHSVKILEITGQTDKPELVAIGMSQTIGVSKSSLPEVVKELSLKSKISSKQASISVSGQSVIVRFISMPKMDSESLKGAIKFEAEKFIPFDINDCVIDFKVIKKEGSDNKLNIVLAASRRAAVEEKIKIAEEAGFSVRVIDVDGFAIANSFARNFQSTQAPSDKTSALINIGRTFTNVSILRGGEIFFARDIAIGTSDFSSFVSKRLAVDPKIADELVIIPKEKPQEVADCMKTIFNNLFEEVKLSFNYYENQGGKSIDEVYASGGGMGLFGLNDIFQENLGSKPIGWKPLGFLNKDASAIDKAFVEEREHYFAVCAGLVLR